MSFVNFYNKIFLFTGRSKAFLTRNELVYISTMFDKTIQKKKSLIKHKILPTPVLFYEISQNIAQGCYKKLILWVEGIKYFTKTFDLQLQSCS